MHIPFLNVKAITESFEPALSVSVREVVASGRYLNGEAVRQFETRFASTPLHRCGKRVRCFDAHLDCDEAHRGLGQRNGSNRTGLYLYSHSQSSCASRANHAFASITETTYTLDPASVRHSNSPNIHMLSCRCIYMDTLVMFHHLKVGLVIEDSAQSHGAVVGGQKVGTLGDAAGF